MMTVLTMMSTTGIAMLFGETNTDDEYGYIRERTAVSMSAISRPATDNERNRN